MNTEIIGIVVQVILMVVLSYPLGKYIARVYQGKKVWTDFMKPIEGWIFRLSGIHPDKEMNWKQFLRALLTVNLGYGAAYLARLVASESGWQFGTKCSPGFQHLHFVYGKLQRTALQWRKQLNLFYSALRYYAVPIPNCCYRYGCHGRSHESFRRKDHTNYR